MRNPKRWAISNTLFALFLAIPAVLFVLAATKISGGCNDVYKSRTNSIVTVCHTGSTAKHYALAALVLMLYVAIVATVAVSTWGWNAFWVHMERRAETDRADRAEGTIRRMQNYQDELTGALKKVVTYLNTTPKKPADMKALRDELMKVGINATRQGP